MVRRPRTQQRLDAATAILGEHLAELPLPADEFQDTKSDQNKIACLYFPDFKGERGDCLPAPLLPRYFLELRRGDLVRFVVYDVEFLSLPEPKIKVSPEGEVNRGDRLELTAESDYEQYTWTALNVSMRNKDKAAQAEETGKGKSTREKGKEDQVTAQQPYAPIERVRGWLPFSWGLPSKKNIVQEDEVISEEKTVSIYPFENGIYELKVEDSNGCKGSDQIKVAVDQHILDLTAGLEFLRPECTDGCTQDDGLLSQSEGFVGFQAEHWATRALMLHGGARFGSTNVDPNPSDLTATLKQTRSISIWFGGRVPLMTNPARQISFYGAADYTYISPRSEGTSDIDSDFFEQAFVGGGWTYISPASPFFGTFVEFGTGKSSNLSTSNDRWKLRSEARIKTGTKWNVFLAGTFDVDPGKGTDDLRILLGVRRNFGFLGDVLVEALGFGDSENE